MPDACFMEPDARKFPICFDSAFGRDSAEAKQEYDADSASGHPPLWVQARASDGTEFYADCYGVSKAMIRAHLNATNEAVNLPRRVAACKVFAASKRLFTQRGCDMPTNDK